MQKSRVEIIIGEDYILINDLDTQDGIIENIVAKTALGLEKQFCSLCG